jgi:predicted amidophosphoribosyltransferase
MPNQFPKQAVVAALEGRIEVEGHLDGKRVLLVDDLFQSGASMNVVAQAIKDRGHARAVHAIALTRTRS